MAGRGVKRFCVGSWSCLLVFVAGISAADAQNKSLPATPTSKQPIQQQSIDDRLTQIKFADGGTLMAHLRTESIPLTTPYGKLVVPVAEIRSLELAVRLPKEIAREVNDAIAELAGPDPEARSTAAAHLFRLREKARIALIHASRSNDKELAKRATELLVDLRARVPSEIMNARTTDLIQTQDSQISGRIDLDVIQVRTAQFGESELKLGDIQSLVNRKSETPLGVLPYNGDLMSLQAKIDQTFAFRITGSATGSVWGTDVYTTDSDLTTAAVHAGVVQAASGVVRIKIVTPPGQFTGSVRNGVVSQNWNAFPGAFRIVN